MATEQEVMTHNQIHDEAEAEYLDNGGSLSVERRDYYFRKAMEALKSAEGDVTALQAALEVLLHRLCRALKGKP